MFRFAKDEALAYFELGVWAVSGARVKESATKQTGLGVFFIPGVGSVGAHFAKMKRALRTVADHYDALDYSTAMEIERSADKLAVRVEEFGRRCDRVVLVGHSLGGFLAQLVLQSDTPPASVSGFVAICAPLHGTWRAKLSPHPLLRALRPDGALVERALARRDRLDRLRGNILTIGTRWDQFIDPYTSAFLDEHAKLELTDVGHAGSLLDAGVHEAVSEVCSKASAVRHGRAASSGL